MEIRENFCLKYLYIKYSIFINNLSRNKSSTEEICMTTFRFDCLKRLLKRLVKLIYAKYFNNK